MTRADGVRVAHPLFQEERGGSSPTSALQLWFMDASIDLVVNLNRLWHSRLPKVVKSNITRAKNKAFFVAEFDGIYYACAIWTNPIARMLPHSEWLELRRFAIAPDAPKNTASRMLSWMAKEIKRQFPHVVKLISYQDCDVHTGCIYMAAGWTATVKSHPGRSGWDRKSRMRNESQTTSTKQRWELDL